MHDNDLMTQFSEGLAKTLSIDGQTYWYLAFNSTQAIDRATIMMVLDKTDSPANGFLYQLANTLPDFGISTLLIYTEFDIFEPSSTIANVDSDGATTTTVQTQADSQSADASQVSVDRSIAATTSALSLIHDMSEQRMQQCALQVANTARAIIAQLKLNEKRTMLLTQGRVASCTFVADDFDIPGIIAINAFGADNQQNQLLATGIANAKAPILDLYHSNYLTLASASLRRVAAARGSVAHYRQRELIGTLPGQRQTGYIAKEIYGWLSYLGY